MLATASARRGAAIVGAALIALAGPRALAQQRVGVNAAVNPAVTGNPPPGAELRRLVIGQQVVFNERIVTTEGGQTQILFLDESTMTVGPNSDMLINQFVYNPNTGSGQMLASLTKGVFRFVGGKLSKQPNAISMKTPSATIGIRGGVFLGNIDAQGRTEVIFVFGQALSVTGLNGATTTLLRPGYEVVVAGPGAAPSAPIPVPQGVTARLLAQLNGRPGGTGGALNVPTEAVVAASPLAADISANLTASIQQAEQNSVRSRQPPVVQVSVLTSQQQQQDTGSQSQPGIMQSIDHGAAPGQTGPTGPTAPSYGGRLFTTDHNGIANGFTQSTPYSGGTLQNSTFSATIGGAAVTVPVATGATGGTTPLGPVDVTSGFIAPDQTFFYADLTPTGALDQREFIYGGLPVSPTFYQPTGKERFFAFNLPDGGQLVSGLSGGRLTNPVISQLYLTAPADSSFAGPLSGGVVGKALLSGLAINGAGAGQRSLIVVLVGNPLATSPQPSLVGQVGGSLLTGGTSPPVAITAPLASATDANGVSFYGGSMISGFVLTGTAQETPVPSGSAIPITFAQPAIAAGLPAGVGSSVSSQTQTGFIGGIMTREAPGSPLPYVIAGPATITTDGSTLRIAATFTGSDPFSAAASGVNSLVLQYGNLGPGTGAAQAFIDDSLFATLQSPVATTTVNGNAATANTYLVSSAVVPSTTLLPSGVSYCACQFLKWGYWGGEVDSTTANGTARIDYGHINTFVVGQPTATADLANLQSLSATASYSGAAVGTVSNAGAQYLAAGGYSGTYNFGTQTGSMQISNFDGRSFGGKVSGSGVSYTGSLAGSGVTGTANGMFFGPRAIETGGNFAVQGAGPYLASGVFAGRQPGQ